MEKKLNVLYSASDLYAPMAGISILSMLKNNVGFEDITIYFISNGVSVSNLNKLESIVNTYKQKLVIVDSTKLDNILENEKVPKFRGSYATFQKIFIDKIIPDDINNLLYIDSDTVIADDLSDILSIDMTGVPYATVRVPMYKEYCHMIGIEKNENNYPNCGVILFDCNNWKKLKCESRIVDFLKKNRKSQYRAADQDILSAVIPADKAILNPKYNVGSSWCFLGIENFIKIHDADSNNFYTLETLRKAIDKPVIYHCLGGFYGRPWEKNNFHPFKNLWNEYKDISPWRDMEPIETKKTTADLLQKTAWKYMPHKVYIMFHRTFMKVQCSRYKDSCKI